MCGRMNITDNEGVRLLMELVGMPSWPSIQARYNVAPTAVLDTVARDVNAESTLTHLQCHWGMVPVWAKPGQFSSPLINARSETVWQKPSFRNLIKHQRVCVPINGFYEWRRQGKTKTPFYIYPANGKAMFVAGIYQKSTDTRCDVTLLTTAANAAMAPIHHRMPVIIESDAVNEWLYNDDSAALNSLMQPAHNELLTFKEVGNYVNNARNEGPECIEAAAG